MQTRPLPTLLALLSLGALGCDQPSGLFDFQDTTGGDFATNTYAVGAEMDVVVFGPQGFDMNTARAAAVGSDGLSEGGPVEITGQNEYPEYGCIVASGRVAVAEDGRIAVTGRLGGAPLDSVQVRAAEIDTLRVRRGVDLWGGEVPTGDLGSSVVVVEGGSASLLVEPVAADGTRLAGRLPLTVDGETEADQWNNAVVYRPDGEAASFERGGVERGLQVRSVPASEVVELRVDRLDIERTPVERPDNGGMLPPLFGGGGGATIDLAYMDESLALLTGLTADGTEVLGLQGEWTLGGWESGSGDAMQVWSDTAGSVCWRGLCTDF